jgi:hypothetical protein
LSAENPLHRRAVQEVADLLGVPLPPVWR